MIAKIKGKISFIKAGYAVVDVNGVGYKIFSTDWTLGKIAGTGEVDLHTHTYVREDSLSLYGFLTLAELEMFEHLISISGIGPKAGLGILTIADPATIRAAITTEDSSILTRVSGVGKKTAERVILELKNKIADLPAGEETAIIAESEVLEALTSLGYAASQAREALKLVSKDIVGVSQRVREALKILGNKK
jgi:Holliday junction DNA helicase RuvA